MVQERKGEIEEELQLALENWESYRDNYRAGRFRKATADLYFFCEHSAKALLLTVGIDPQYHEGIRRMISMHFIKPGAMPVKVARYLGNLHDRRKTAEYSRQAGWEFTEDEVRTYTQWAGESVKWFLKNIKKNVPKMRFKSKELVDSIDDAFRALGISEQEEHK
ncbi:MAG: HEPN domain-containing protein [Thermodesulfobacteriota bacterium]